jgi:flagellar biosynthetic protein FliR
MIFNPAEYQVEQLQFLFLMFTRIAAMMQVFPIFGSQYVPWQMKMGLSLFLSLILFPLVVPQVVETPNNLLPYAVLIIKELLVGLTIGFVASMIFTGVSMAGNLIDAQIGFSMVQSYNPFTDQGSSVLGQFKVIVFSIIFLGLQGHQFLVLALVKSFERIPIMGIHFNTGKLAEIVAYFIANIFDISIRLAGPVIILLLIISVASGVLSRTVPQMNMFVVDMPLKVAVGLLGLAASFPILYYVFEKAYTQLQSDLLNLLYFMV